MLLAPAPVAAVKYELGYSGVPLFGTHEKAVAFDTETNIITDLDPGAVNDLALAQASDGDRTVLVHPADLARFLDDHEGTPFVGHNIAYDFWVVEKALRAAGKTAHLERWWARADNGLLHDTMILDALIRLAEGKGETGDDGEKFYMRGLGDVAREAAGIHLNKQDPYRRRYGEIIGKKFSEVTEKGFWEYAAADAYATARTWPALHRKALALATRFAFGVGPNGEKRLARWLKYGLLTEQVQVKGAIALAQLERNGMPYDPGLAAVDAARWRAVVDECVAAIDRVRPDFFKKRNGRFQVAEKSMTPQVNQGDLIQALADAGLKIKESLPEFQPPQSQGKTFQEKGFAISRAADDWAPYEKYDPFLGHWIRLGEAVKRLAFYEPFRPPERTLFTGVEAPPEVRIRPRYHLLMRTGRTSCSAPNLQQCPRDPKFREIFRAPPGKKIITADFSSVELATLAATCLERFGHSTLAEVIRKKIDPHAYTAAAILGVPYEEFRKLKETDPARYKDARQKAKICNFGYSGGLGALKFQAYAAAQYGVHFSLEEAEAFRRKLTEDAYPELSAETGYLADDTLGALAQNTGLSRGEVLAGIPGGAAAKPWIGRVLTRLLGGATSKANGEPFDARFFEQAWDYLQGLGRKAPPTGPLSDAARRKLRARTGDPLLAQELTLGNAVTITGRVRARVRYTVERNGPFQGLAADGAKLALYRVLRAGFKTVMFCHDEIAVEVDDRGEDGNREQGLLLERIMIESMEEALGGHVPAAAEWDVADHWKK